VHCILPGNGTDFQKGLAVSQAELNKAKRMLDVKAKMYDGEYLEVKNDQHYGRRLVTVLRRSTLLLMIGVILTTISSMVYSYREL